MSEGLNDRENVSLCTKCVRKLAISTTLARGRNIKSHTSFLIITYFNWFLEEIKDTFIMSIPNPLTFAKPNVILL